MPKSSNALSKLRVWYFPVSTVYCTSALQLLIARGPDFLHRTFKGPRRLINESMDALCEVNSKHLLCAQMMHLADPFWCLILKTSAPVPVPQNKFRDPPVQSLDVRNKNIIQKWHNKIPHLMLIKQQNYKFDILKKDSWLKNSLRGFWKIYEMSILRSFFSIYQCILWNVLAGHKMVSEIPSACSKENPNC